MGKPKDTVEVEDKISIPEAFETRKSSKTIYHAPPSKPKILTEDL